MAVMDAIKTLWNDWNVRGAILLSLFFQVLLLLLSPTRKRNTNTVIAFFIWLAYLFADKIAIFAIGRISTTQKLTPQPSSSDDIAIMAFWSTFLLTHLGGPDTITALDVEDNELYRRQFLQLVSQTLGTAYVLLQTISNNNVLIPSILLCLVGVIKYAERVSSLYLASITKMKDSILITADPGPNYAKLMEEYASKKQAHIPIKVVHLSADSSENKQEIQISEETTVLESDVEVVQKAYRYFNIIAKRVLVDLGFSSRDVRNEVRSFFNSLSPKDALKVLEVQLNIMYETLFTKAPIVYRVVGFVCRLICSSLVVSALALFYFYVDKNGFDKRDVAVTYVLLLGTVAIDNVAVLMIIFSDWTVAALTTSSGLAAALLRPLLTLKGSTVYDRRKYSVLFARWSGALSRHNLITYCLEEHAWRSRNIKKRCPKFYFVYEFFRFVFDMIRKFFHFLHLGKFMQSMFDLMGVNEIVEKVLYVSKKQLDEELWKFIFDDLKAKSKSAEDPKMAEKIYLTRSDCALKEDTILSDKDRKKLIRNHIHDISFDDSLLRWHIATELLYHTDSVSNEDRERSKVLSEYLLCLLIMQPKLMADVAKDGNLRYRDTCAEAKRCFQNWEDLILKREEGKSIETKACEMIIGVCTEVEPRSIKGERSKSVLFEASILAKELMKMQGEKWMFISEVWVEMLAYAATHCAAIAHAQRLSKGGELLTFVWLLMAQFGIGKKQPTELPLIKLVMHK